MIPQVQNETRRIQQPALDDESLLSSGQVKARYGNVSDMCIWRWLRDERLGFPQPVKINKRNYWRLGALREFDRRHDNKAAA